MHLVSLIIIAVKTFNFHHAEITSMSSVCISVCVYMYTYIYTDIYTYVWVKFVWCSLPQACRILHRKEMGSTGLASEPAPTSELCASSLRHPGNEICWLTQWKQKLAFFSHSWLRVFLPAGQGVRVLKFWNLFLFPSGTNKPKCVLPKRKGQDSQWEPA